MASDLWFGNGSKQSGRGATCHWCLLAGMVIVFGLGFFACRQLGQWNDQAEVSRREAEKLPDILDGLVGERFEFADISPSANTAHMRFAGTSLILQFNWSGFTDNLIRLSDGNGAGKLIDHRVIGGRRCLIFEHGAILSLSQNYISEVHLVKYSGEQRDEETSNEQ